MLPTAPATVVAAVPFLRSPMNVSDSEWFRSVKDAKVEPQVGRAFRSFRGVAPTLRGDTADNLFFPVARSIWGPGGTFLGAVQVGVELAYFARVFQVLDGGFRSLDVRSEAKLGIYRTKDGSVVAAFPITEALLAEIGGNVAVLLIARKLGGSNLDRLDAR